MIERANTESVKTLVIGGGQAGLAMGYQLSQRDLPYKIVDANPRVGDAWRNRWDSLSLFTPSRLNGLPGMRFPGYHWGFPSKDEMADYLETYAQHFDINIETGLRIDRLTKESEGFVATSGVRQFVADNVVIAMSSWQKARLPKFASELDSNITQFHVADYQNPEQLQAGPVLVVGAGNSGAEIAKELVRTHEVFLSGPDTGHIPFRPESVAARVLMPIVGRVVFHRLLTTSTPFGRKARPKMVSSGEPLIRVKPKDLAALGVKRVGRVEGVESGRPVIDGGRVLETANVVWCTGFRPGFSWIDLRDFDTVDPNHQRGIVTDVPGLYLLGLKFLYSVSSEQIHGVGRDAGYLADAISSGRSHDEPTATQPEVPQFESA